MEVSIFLKKYIQKYFITQGNNEINKFTYKYYYALTFPCALNASEPITVSKDCIRNS